MKQVTRTRVDTFLSNSGYCRVIGRKNHVLSTEVQIKKNFSGVMRKFPKYDDRFDKFFHKDEFRVAHAEPEYETSEQKEENSFKLQLNDFPINRSIEQCDFHPLTCQNSFDVRPRDQLTLLPYLTEESIRENHKYRAPQDIALQWTDAAGAIIAPPDEDRAYAYHPTEQGRVFLQIERDGHPPVDDEKEVYGNTLAQRSRWDANVLQDTAIRFILKATQLILDELNGQIPGAADKLVGTEGIPMVKMRKLIDGKY